ncbi:hypothetical protein [uncultured Thiodictyon sp.]|uniref:hypothetical protein n=1 Tax=uncultured Thiodictyon sp. TaxID=1846217 RepID=UPI0025E3CCD6|nr:hypothetical protein [uncultured Thiodictyon sp.]
MRYLLLIFVFTVLSQVVLADHYNTYQNARFGYSIDYPAGILYPQGEADNGDGQKFLTKDADASLLVYGSNNALEQTLEDVYLDAARSGSTDSPKKVVTYKAMKRDWFVVSGVDGERVFYQKTILAGDQFFTFILEYPAGKKSIFDPIIKRVSASFKPK